MKKSLLTLALFSCFVTSAMAAGPATGEKSATLPSGVQMTWSKQGSGASPLATSTVTVHYRGTLMNGTEFDSSYKRGQPISFPLNRVIKCWTDGLQAMKVGDKAELVCPPNIAYGERGAPGVIPPNATLKFEVELISIAN